MNKIALNEKQYVEEPFLHQLDRLGWRIVRAGEDVATYTALAAESSPLYVVGQPTETPKTSGIYDPAVTFREGFHEVILEKELRAALLQINRWLEKDQLPEIIREITVPQKNSLLEANQEILEKLLENTSAENRKTGERSETVRFIDFKNPGNNSFLAISQFKVTIPGTEKHIIPDIVLFINGLPIGVVECKSPYISDPMGEAVEQLLRYQNRRGSDKEGNDKLFWYNQLVIACCKQTAKYSTITGNFEHFVEWKDPYPAKLSDIDTEGSESVTSQHVLIQGMLTKRNILDIIQSFLIFQENSHGKLIKVAPRYQQYRTVGKIVERLKSGKAPKEKGGVVWHTQGSGKSLTMMFAVRRMYHDSELASYKVVFITDRTDLEKQLKDTAKSVGYKLNVAHNILALKKYLGTDTPDLIMGMIHKFQEREVRQKFPLLNQSEKILIMVDEAHRTQYSILGANLAKALPNAVRIAFTGTPIEKTETTFGDYIDKYSIKQAVEDGVTVEIIYEGRTHRGEVSDPEAMNKKFEDVFSAVDNETRQKILNRYTWKAYLEAEETIRDKAKDMLNHFVAHIFPNGFKAQVVAVSRLAAIRYKKSLEAALQEKIAELRHQSDTAIDIELLAKMRIEAVISGSPNDPPEMKEYTDENRHETIIDSFKLPFGGVENNISGDVGIIVVQSMLLTGFDAPVEQVMYLDNVIREHNLLQAIARVNRVEHNKSCGFVVDYVGIARHLREALAVFADDDVKEILEVVKDDAKDLDDLQFTRRNLHDFFHKFDIADPQDIDACVDVLADEETRNDFLVLFKKFTTAMDKVLPKQEALEFVDDLKIFSFIGQVARNRYRDEKFNIRDASKKIREIVEKYLVSKGVDPKIPPLPIFSPEFSQKIKREKSAKTQAEELKYAISEHINIHLEEDPELYERLGEKLAKLLEEYKEKWELLAKELRDLLEEIQQGRAVEETYGFQPKSEMPFLGLLKKEIFGIKNLSDLELLQRELLIQTTKDILERIKSDTQLVDFWNNLSAQKKLKSFIASHLLTVFKNNKKMFENRAALAQKILELAFHLHAYLHP
jgi:type I restriction enzyme R subunit